MKEDLLFSDEASVGKYNEINSLEMAVEGRSREEQAGYCAELIVRAVVTDAGSVQQLREQVREANARDRQAREEDERYDGCLAHDAMWIALNRVKSNHRLTSEKVRYNLQKRFERNRLNGTLDEYETQQTLYQD